MNIIVCNTLLQAIIAEKIIDKYPDEDFSLVLYRFDTQNQKKFEFYFERLKKKVKDSYYFIHPSSDKIKVLKFLYRLSRDFRGKIFDKIFISNYTEYPVQIILSNIHFNQLITFDDGAFNLVKEAGLYKNSPITFKEIFTRIFLNKKYNNQKIRQLISKHYTIFNGFDNVIDSNVEYISLMPDLVQNNNADTIKILLGQVIYDNDADNIALHKKVITDFNIDYYFPHPGDRYILEDVDYIDTDLVFEDYLVSNNSFNYEIYTYFSTAALNVSSASNVKVVSLKPKMDNARFIEAYEIFKKVNIPIIEI